MTTQINIFSTGDVVRYQSSTGVEIEATVAKVRDTQAEPLKDGREPQSRYLLTLEWVDPLEGTQQRTVYGHRVTTLVASGWVTL